MCWIGSSWVARLFAPIETGLYRLADVDPDNEQNWVSYAIALLTFHVVGIVVLYALQRLQGMLPLNTQQMDAAAPDLALNTAVGFATNTSWQSDSGETIMSNVAQIAGIVVQSFPSAASGIAMAIGLVRGLPGARRIRSVISGSI